jgi:hypothetical protein
MKRISRAVVAVAAGLAMASCAQSSTGAHSPMDATYMVEGEAVTLVSGVAEKTLVPGAASKQVTRYFGHAVEIDLDGDGMLDTAFLLVQDSGGSGTFYYVAAALRKAGGYVGTNAILLGDRIAPQRMFIDPEDPARFVLSYGERVVGQAGSAPPMEMVSRTFRYEHGSLVELVPPRSGSYQVPPGATPRLFASTMKSVCR